MAEHFHRLKIAEVVAETDEASSIRFEVPIDLEEAFRFKAGQHLTLRADIGGEEVRRNYSLCTAPFENDLMVTVKRIAGGVFSNWAAEQLKPGDVLDVMTPHGSFTTTFDPGAEHHYIAFAGGSGITPVMSLIRTALAEEARSHFTLFYGNRDSSSVIFLEALAALKDRYMSRLELFHFLDQEEGDIDLFNGMLDRRRCEEAIEHLVDEPRKVDAWFICGPGPMMDAAEAALLDRGIVKERIHIDGRTRKVDFNEANILDSARAAGLPAPFACKAGVCATCRAKVTKGKVEMAARYGLTDEEVAAGYILTCQSVPAGDGVAVDYDA
jgi:ring-1,2-phenylacetyl-CoA epoxidase subunit PaaE